MVPRITGIVPNVYQYVEGLFVGERERREGGGKLEKPTGADDKSLPRSSTTFYAC